MNIQKDKGTALSEEVIALLQSNERFTNCTAVCGGANVLSETGMYVRIISDYEGDKDDLVFIITASVKESMPFVLYSGKQPKHFDILLIDGIKQNEKLFASAEQVVDYIRTQAICEFVLVGL